MISLKLIFTEIYRRHTFAATHNNNNDMSIPLIESECIHYTVYSLLWLHRAENTALLRIRTYIKWRE